jgi:PII-like signaling protein
MGVPATAARRVQVFVGEADHVGHQPSYRAMLDYLRREGAAGATVVRGIAGFGVHSRIHQASILDLSADLPMTLTWIDRPDEVDRLLPGLLAVAGSGIVTVEDVSVVGPGEQHLHHERTGAAPDGIVSTTTPITPITDSSDPSPAESA